MMFKSLHFLKFIHAVASWFLTNTLLELEKDILNVKNQLKCLISAVIMKHNDACLSGAWVCY